MRLHRYTWAGTFGLIAVSAALFFALAIALGFFADPLLTQNTRESIVTVWLVIVIFYAAIVACYRHGSL